MKYPYKFIEEPESSTYMELPEHIDTFAEFISDISTVETADDVLTYIDDVLSGTEDEIDLTGNAPTVIVRPETSIAFNEFALNSNEVQEMETVKFRKLVVIWKEHLIEEREERRKKAKD